MMDWRSKFKSHTLRTNFMLGLTRPQLEYLCAVADDVVWDRFNFGGQYEPRNFIASSGALEKRGLIEPKLSRAKWTGHEVYEIRATYKLTEAGSLIVQLLKLTGIYIASDNAIQRKAAKRVVSMRSKRA